MPAARYVQARQYASIFRSSSLESRSAAVFGSAAVGCACVISSAMISPPLDEPPPAGRAHHVTIRSRCTPADRDQPGPGCRRGDDVVDQGALQPADPRANDGPVVRHKVFRQECSTRQGGRRKTLDWVEDATNAGVLTG